jgi:hypothetical protein
MVETWYKYLIKYEDVITRISTINPTKLSVSPKFTLCNSLRFRLWTIKNDEPYNVLMTPFTLPECDIIYGENDSNDDVDNKSCYITSTINDTIVRQHINNVISEGLPNNSIVAYESIDSLTRNRIIDNMKCIIL